MALLKKLAGETAIYGLSSIVGRVVNWVILTPYLTREFTLDEYGIVNDLYFNIALLLVFFTYRMETAFFRFASRAQKEQLAGGATADTADAVFTTATLSIIASTVLLTALLWVQAPAIANYLLYPGRADYVRIFTLIIAFDALAAIPFARLRMDGRPLRFAFIKIGAIVANILLVFFFLEGCPWLIDHGQQWATLLYQPERRVAYVFWTNLLASGLTLLWLAPLYRHLAWRFVGELWQRMLRYALPLVVAGMAGIVNLLIGTPMLKYLGGGTPEENLALGGLYAAATKLAVLMSLFVQAFNYAAEPFFFRHAAESDDRAVYADVARAFALVGSLAFLGIMLYLEVIQYFLGRDFRKGLGVLPIALIANFFLGLFYNFAIGFKLTDQTRWGGYIALGGAVITIVVNVVFIPSLSYYAPAWATLACFLFMTTAAYYYNRRRWPVPYAVGRMAYYLALGLVAWGSSLLLAGYLPDGLVYRIAVNTVLLAATLLVLFKTEGPWLKSVLKG